jgi:hypothetical protein
MTLTLQQLFRQHFDAFASRFAVSRDMLRAAWCVTHCRTRVLGGHVNSCPEGHYHQVAYNSCCHRCCPRCGWLAREKWLARWKERLLPCPHHHIVFTVPHELNRLWRLNKKAFAETLFAAASETLMELLGDAKYVGGRPGLLCALHTWKQTLAPHIHLHCLVTAGALGGEGRWLDPKKSCLLPRKVLMIKFRGKFKAMLRARVRRGEIQLPAGMSGEELTRQLWRLTQKAWNVKIHDAYRHGSGVATYLARYLKGGPVGESRLITQREGGVVFRYRIGTDAGGDGKRQGVMSLPVLTFLGRWLEHVPPKRLQTVRGYGLYGGNQHARLDEARRALGAEPAREVGPRSWQQWCESAGMEDACRCPECGRELISHHEFRGGRDPPPAAFEFREQRQPA